MKKGLMGLWVIALASGCGAGEGEPSEALAPERPGQELIADEAHRGEVQVPVVLDGVRYSPEEFRQLEGQTLYYVLTPEAKEEGVLYAFSGKQRFEEYLGAGERKQAGGPSAQAYGDAHFFEHTGVTGAEVVFNSINDVQDLRPNVLRCTWSGCVSWDNQISSFIPARTVPYTCLKEYVYLTGAELCVSSGVSAVSNLGSYGWNDRASSIDFR